MPDDLTTPAVPTTVDTNQAPAPEAHQAAAAAAPADPAQAPAPGTSEPVVETSNAAAPTEDSTGEGSTEAVPEGASPEMDDGGSAEDSPPAPGQPAVPTLPPAVVAAKLAELFPALFTPGQAKPLKLRIQADIQQRAPGVFTKKALSVFLHRLTWSRGYLVALTQSPHRFDLDGQPAGDVAEEHRQAATTELARRKALMDARRAAEREAARANRRPARGPRPGAGAAAGESQPGAAALAGTEANNAAAGQAAGERPPRAPRPEGRGPRPEGRRGPGAEGQGGRPGDRGPRPAGSERRGPRPDGGAPQRDRAAQPGPRGDGAGRPPRAGGGTFGSDRRNDRPPRDLREGRDQRDQRDHREPRDERPQEPLTPEGEARRARAQLLRAWETTALSRGNFCALKGLKEADFEALLTQARSERGSR
jgi:sRNA-binding protein